ncbi:hypothetical protein DH2020_013992 [Rehmannia glutinosa]|uniref:Uncharacterized protein n=1 Tax=Rehmannia glutinosa TaxID=99300 RepID=A0ABR0WV68_REHGL
MGSDACYVNYSYGHDVYNEVHLRINPGYYCFWQEQILRGKILEGGEVSPVPTGLIQHSSHAIAFTANSNVANSPSVNVVYNRSALSSSNHSVSPIQSVNPRAVIEHTNPGSLPLVVHISIPPATSASSSSTFSTPLIPPPSWLGMYIPSPYQLACFSSRGLTHPVSPDLSLFILRATAMILQPALAKSRQNSKPRPEDAPVTMTTFPSREFNESRDWSSSASLFDGYECEIIGSTRPKAFFHFGGLLRSSIKADQLTITASFEEYKYKSIPRNAPFLRGALLFKGQQYANC